MDVLDELRSHFPQETVEGAVLRIFLQGLDRKSTLNFSGAQENNDILARGMLEEVNKIIGVDGYWRDRILEVTEPSSSSESSDSRLALRRACAEYVLFLANARALDEIADVAESPTSHQMNRQGVEVESEAAGRSFSLYAFVIEGPARQFRYSTLLERIVLLASAHSLPFSLLLGVFVGALSSNGMIAFFTACVAFFVFLAIGRTRNA